MILSATWEVLMQHHYSKKEGKDRNLYNELSHLTQDTT